MSENAKTKLKKIFCAAAFLAIAAWAFFKTCEVCRFSSWSGGGVAELGHFTYSRVRHLADYPIDVLAFGSSHANRSFAASELYGQYGFSAYNIGGSWQPFMASYYLLKKLLECEKPKVVLLDVFYFCNNGGGYRSTFDALPLSPLKIEAVKERCKKSKESEIGYVFNILKYHGAWKKLREFGFRKTDSSMDENRFQGFSRNIKIYKPTKQQAEFSGWENTGKEKAKVFEEELTYMKKFIELCKKNDIPVVLYKAPLADTNQWNAKRHNAVKEFAASVGVPFLDFHTKEIWQKSRFSFATDLADAGHDNTLGAIKVTRYLGDFLHANYDIPDRRGDKKFAALQADYERWRREVFSEGFVFESDMASYLERLEKSRPKDFTAIISVKDNCQAKMGPKIKSLLQRMGFKSDKVFEKYGHSFIGVWQGGRVIFERQSETIDNKETDALEYRGVLPCGSKFYVKSAGYRCGNASSIIIAGKEWSKNSRGFNVVLYDNKTGRVVDSVCWDTHKDAGVTHKR